MAGMERAPIERAIHDISVADGRVRHDIGTVSAGMMAGTMMRYAQRVGRPAAESGNPPEATVAATAITSFCMTFSPHPHV